MSVATVGQTVGIRRWGSDGRDQTVGIRRWGSDGRDPTVEIQTVGIQTVGIRNQCCNQGKPLV